MKIFPLVLLIVFMYFILVLTEEMKRFVKERSESRLKDEMRKEFQETNANMCKNCYYKKRCEELEKEADGQTPT